MKADAPDARSAAVAESCLLRGIDFERLLHGRVCIVGVGNRERGDDAAGSLLAASLHGKVRAEVIDAGAVPENYLGKVLGTGPDVIVIVDAVDFAAAPGTVAQVDPERLRAGGLSTHAVSLSMAVRYLSAQSEAEILVIGIQPARLAPSCTLSEPVARGVALLHDALTGCLPTAPQTKGKRR